MLAFPLILNRHVGHRGGRGRAVGSDSDTWTLALLVSMLLVSTLLARVAQDRLSGSDHVAESIRLEVPLKVVELGWLRQSRVVSSPGEVDLEELVGLWMRYPRVRLSAVVTEASHLVAHGVFVLPFALLLLVVAIIIFLVIIIIITITIIIIIITSGGGGGSSTVGTGEPLSLSRCALVC